LYTTATKSSSLLCYILSTQTVNCCFVSVYVCVSMFIDKMYLLYIYDYDYIKPMWTDTLQCCL